MGTRRTLWIAATVLAASALAGVGAPELIRAEPSDAAPGTISVTGSGSVETAPDTATTSFGVVTQGATAPRRDGEQLRRDAEGRSTR